MTFFRNRKSILTYIYFIIIYTKQIYIYILFFLIITFNCIIPFCRTITIVTIVIITTTNLYHSTMWNFETALAELRNENVMPVCHLAELCNENVMPVCHVHTWSRMYPQQYGITFSLHSSALHSWTSSFLSLLTHSHTVSLFFKSPYYEYHTVQYIFLCRRQWK